MGSGSAYIKESHHKELATKISQVNLDPLSPSNNRSSDPASLASTNGQLPLSPKPITTLPSPPSSVTPTQTSPDTEYPPRLSLHPEASPDTFHPDASPGYLPTNNLLSALPSDVALAILEKIPAPTLDCSNPFSILENCSLADPTLCTYNLKRLSATHPKLKRIIPEQVSAQPSSTTPTIAPSLPNPVPNSHFSLVVDLSPFKAKPRRKPKGKGPPPPVPKLKKNPPGSPSKLDS
ncbi:hypothetical protein MRB53_011090 [Persea americana]|uniref:Uncharacterized protein n=1 Tax=Persea americana TaxID=3435 RepID=A0ACC2LUE3_PERAE|nr:hypothetical protein MRB53_011090 [Persea americana]